MTKFFDCLDRAIESIIVYLPIIALGAFGMGYVVFVTITPHSIERLQFLISLDAIAATAAGVGFYASYSCRDELRKATYFDCAEKFFHAFVLLFIATLARGCMLLLDDFPWHLAWEIRIQGILAGITIMFFAYGLWRFIAGLSKLLHFIYAVNRGKVPPFK